MHKETLGGIGLIAVWIVLVIFVEWRSGLAHIPLAAGTVFIARGFVLNNLDRPSAD